MDLVDSELVHGCIRLGSHTIRTQTRLLLTNLIGRGSKIRFEFKVLNGSGGWT